MAIIRDPSNPARILKINEDGSINVVAVLTELEVKNDAGNPLNVTDPAFGTAGGTTAPPNGTGVIGWLRGIYDKLVAGIAVTGTQTDALTNAQLRASAVPVSGTVTAAVNNFPTTQAVSGNVNIANSPTVSVSNFPSTQTNALTNTELRATALPVSGPATNAELRASALPVSLSGVGTAMNNPIYAFERPANLKVKQVSAANTAQTVTLPAVAGEFHYIIGAIVQRYNSTATAVAGAAANLAVTTTNLGGLEFRFGNAVTAGGGDTPVNLQPSNPVKSDTVNTATTVVVPALGAGIISVVNVIYFTAP